LLALYLDECLEEKEVARQLRAAGHLVYLASDLGLKGQSDEQQLRTATELGAAIATQNQADFTRLHRQWQAEGRPHPGILLTRQRLNVGLKIQRLGRAARLLTQETAANQLLRLDQFATEQEGLLYLASLSPPRS